MVIWIDGDACPKACKEIIFRRVAKQGLKTILVANSYQQITQFANVQLIMVSQEPDAADRYILEHSALSDLVISSDIPLASLLVKKGVTTISFHGEKFSPSNVGDRLATRDLMTHLREGGEMTKGIGAYSEKDKQRFASCFDAQLAALATKV